MIVITVKQPWAYLIAAGIKDIENRTWKCPEKYIGKRVLIHASASAPKSIRSLLNTDQINTLFKSDLYNDTNFAKKYNTGSIIGSVEIVDCVINHNSIWAEKTQYKISENNRANCERIENSEVLKDAETLVNPIYNWIIANPILFEEPITNVKGKLGFWEYANIVSEPEEKDGQLFCHCSIPVKLESQVMNICGDFSCRYCGGKWYR